MDSRMSSVTINRKQKMKCACGEEKTRPGRSKSRKLNVVDNKKKSPFESSNNEQSLLTTIDSFTVMKNSDDDGDNYDMDDEDMSNNNKRRPQFDMIVKILIIGDTSVGKSSLLCRYVHNDFDIAHYATIGVDFKCVNVRINDKYVARIQFWDTAGQERFHSITASYFRGSDACILVYDMTDANSFKNIKRWNGHLKEKAERKFPRVIVGNKVDLVSQRVVNNKDVDELVEELNDEVMGGVKHFQASALSGENVDTLFEEIIKQAVLNISKKDIRPSNINTGDKNQ
jgi:small GTP-binding protein